MTTQISTFNFKSHQVRIQSFNNEPYFCLSDVCDVLGLNRRSAETFNLNEKGCNNIATLTKGGEQIITFINEPNLYRIIFKSRKAEAVEFQNWVFEEVLPQIRKTGQYSQQPSPLAQIETDQEAVQVITKLFHSLNGGYELATEIQRNQPYLARELEKQIGGHFIYNLQGPTRNALDAARKYIQAKSERIAIVRGMVSLLDGLPTPQPTVPVRKQYGRRDF
ncbi:Bro-N domain-containing protein [Mannheimia pernigra]|uniref:BRO-N domain-containing protein n=1 Tax=Mannheimia pernigra TaxID=111844 RepID=UPI001EE16D36|nr:BRO family protein [Mannheimia pernigra]